MKKVFFLTLLAALAAALIMNGCSKKTLDLPATEPSLNYEEDFGGYDISDEAPGFGDETIQQEMGEDAETQFTEPSMDPLFDSLGHRTDIRIYRMELLWGMLEFDSTVTEPTDWSGSLEIDRGAVRIITLIRFERGDHIVKPRHDHKLIEWVSITQPHFDGIMVLVYDVADSDETEPNSLTLTTGPYQRTFSMDELEELSEIVEVDDIGNKVSINASITTPVDRESGFLKGRWYKSDRENGLYYGRWTSWDGFFRGHVRGHWGLNNDGEKVFFGKWIDRQGTFKGLLRGKWGTDGSVTDNSDPVGGWFNGVWADRTQTVKGKLGGKWATRPYRLGENDTGNGNEDGRRQNGEIARNCEKAPGFFHGRWAVDQNE